MEYQATAKYLRTSPRKLRLIASAVRGLPAKEALSLLSQMPKSAAKPLAKVLSSAVANAKQRDVTVDALLCSTIEVMEGPMMKRWRAVSRGRVHPYTKRMAHVRVVLTDEKKEGNA
jgi:large subunit ribosomal protein L22